MLTGCGCYGRPREELAVADELSPKWIERKWREIRGRRIPGGAGVLVEACRDELARLESQRTAAELAAEINGSPPPAKATRIAEVQAEAKSQQAEVLAGLSSLSQTQLAEARESALASASKFNRRRWAASKVEHNLGLAVATYEAAVAAGLIGVGSDRSEASRG